MPTGPTNAPPPWRERHGCVIVRVRVTPKSSKDTIDGLEVTVDGPAFRVRVRAAPADGEANTAVTRALSDALDVPRSAISLAAGPRSRVKSFEISGDVTSLRAKLDALLARLANP
ncbi:MAG: DUF167 family protein [Hyphomicrobium sp.]|nr:DUF167 family protein [Hyphomicrobium sp.]